MNRLRLAPLFLLLACGSEDAPTDADSSSTAEPASSSDGVEPGTSDTSSGTTASVDDGSSSTDDGDEPLPACPTFAAGTMTGTVMSPAIVEASGIAVSRTHEDVLWVHNDSGDGARAFAIATDGTTLAEIAIDGALAFDWEDMALGPGPEDGDFLYFGDIGDNSELRGNITVYRVPEPDPASGDGTITDVTALVMEYPDGSHNAETLLSDPLTGDLFIVTKTESGTSIVFRAAFPHDEAATIELENVAQIELGGATLPGSPLATGGDISADGSLVAIRTYGGAYGWRRTASATIGEAFATDPCSLPTEARPQGEALAISPTGFFTISEGATPPIWFFARQ